jgi:trans-2,3-dihydro-3-hydroxyanthranilate isomerase
MAGPSGLPLTWLDVFTSTPLAGNPLAVVGDAGALDDHTMLAFARETGLSETTFVQPATEARATYRTRIWTVNDELPFAGHPSLGTAVAVAAARRETDVRYVQETRAGLQPVEVELRGRAARTSMLQEPAVFDEDLEPGTVLAALGLGAGDAHPDLVPRVGSTGVRHVLVLAASREALGRTRPVPARLGDLLARTGATTVYLAHWDEAAAVARARAWWLPRGALGEDPATGSAAGPLMAFLHDHAGAERLTVRQGEELGRPSVLACAMEAGRARVGGDVVLVSEGRVFL